MVQARSFREEKATPRRLQRARPSAAKPAATSSMPDAQSDRSASANVSARGRESPKLPSASEGARPSARGSSLLELRGYDAAELEAVAELGYLLYSNRQLDKARVVFEGLAAIDPTCEYYTRALATIFLALGDLDRACDAASRSIALARDPVMALMLRAEIHLAAARPAKAAADLEHILRTARDHVRTPLARLLYERARAAGNGTPPARHQQQKRGDVAPKQP